MLVKNPEGRIGLEEVTRHPWFTASPALPGLLALGQRVNPGAAKQTEADIVAVVREAQVRLRSSPRDGPVQWCSNSAEPGGEERAAWAPGRARGAWEEGVYCRLGRELSRCAASPNASQVPLRPIDSDNIDDLADDILAEEEADDLLEELTLTGV